MYCLLFGGTPFRAAQSLTTTGSEFSLYNVICNDDWGVPQTMGYDRIPTGGRHPNPSLEGAGVINLLDRFLQKDYHVRITLDEVKVCSPFSLSVLAPVADSSFHLHFIFLLLSIPLLIISFTTHSDTPGSSKALTTPRTGFPLHRLKPFPSMSLCTKHRMRCPPCTSVGAGAASSSNRFRRSSVACARSLGKSYAPPGAYRGNPSTVRWASIRSLSQDIQARRLRQ